MASVIVPGEIILYPVLTIFDHVHIPVWLALISVSLTLSVYWVYKKSLARGLDPKLALDLSLALMVGSFLGGRLAHILWEEPAYYFAHPWAILKIWQGGMVFYGGLLGASVAAAYILWRQRSSWALWADFFAPIVAVNYGVGRLGCFLNGCCYGRACTLPWAVEFKSHLSQGLPLIARHPTQIYAALWELTLALVLIFLDKKGLAQPGRLALVWLLFHAIGRILMELFRDDDRGQLILSHGLSFWISLVLASLALIGLSLGPRLSRWFS